MLDLSTVADSLLDPVAQVVAGLQEQEPQLEADSIMLVGAWCRDALHAALGHTFSTSATRDVDLALALDEWGTYERLSRVLPRAGDSGVRFRVAGFVVDLLPFGDVEDPRGTIVPPSRAEGMSVWAFAEIFAGASPLVLTPSLSIRCPTVPGYTAAKLAAWLDRSEWGEVKDANDLALAAHWYSGSGVVASRLYDVPDEQRILVDEEVDVARAAAHLLGRDVAALIGLERAAELLVRWPGDLELLVRNFVHGATRRGVRQARRQRSVVDALTRGLTAGVAGSSA